MYLSFPPFFNKILQLALLNVYKKIIIITSKKNLYKDDACRALMQGMSLMVELVSTSR